MNSTENSFSTEGSFRSEIHSTLHESPMQLLVPSSVFQTKEWRKMQKWYTNGKANECEIFQKSIMNQILKRDICKTQERINYKTNEISVHKTPLSENDGFEWSENFDGYIDENEKIYYFNFKFVCDDGGAQTRTLRETYLFIKNQFLLLENTNNNNNIYFINILDGDTCYKHANKFKYLKDQYPHFCDKVFIGDLHKFQNEYTNFF